MDEDQLKLFHRESRQIHQQNTLYVKEDSKPAILEKYKKAMKEFKKEEIISEDSAIQRSS